MFGPDSYAKKEIEIVAGCAKQVVQDLHGHCCVLLVLDEPAWSFI